jgi:hypothetical protein
MVRAGPPVFFIDDRFWLPQIDHRLNGEGHARLKN